MNCQTKYHTVELLKHSHEKRLRKSTRWYWMIDGVRYLSQLKHTAYNSADFWRNSESK